MSTLSGIISKKEDMSPELQERFEAWKNKRKPHPLFTSVAQDVGRAPKGEEAVLVPPAHARACNFTKHFISRERGTRLNTTLVRSRFLSALDPM